MFAYDLGTKPNNAHVCVVCLTCVCRKSELSELYRWRFPSETRIRCQDRPSVTARLLWLVSDLHITNSTKSNMRTATKDRLPDMAVIFVQSNSSVMLLCCCSQVIMRGCLCVCVSEIAVLLLDFGYY